jgi:hypothetical protein
MHTPTSQAPRARLRRLARRCATGAVLVATATGCQDALGPAAPAGAAPAARPALQRDADELPGQYIVLFADGVADPRRAPAPTSPGSAAP